MLGFSHQDAPDTPTALIGMDSEVIDPAPVTVVPGHDGADDCVADRSDEEHVIADGNLPRDVLRGIVPRPCEPARFPQADHSAGVAGLERPHLDRLTRVHHLDRL